MTYHLLQKLHSHHPRKSSVASYGTSNNLPSSPSRLLPQMVPYLTARPERTVRLHNACLGLGQPQRRKTVHGSSHS